jgi:hypothetical protein
MLFQQEASPSRQGEEGQERAGRQAGGHVRLARYYLIIFTIYNV